MSLRDGIYEELELGRAESLKDGEDLGNEIIGVERFRVAENDAIFGLCFQPLCERMSSSLFGFCSFNGCPCLIFG